MITGWGGREMITGWGGRARDDHWLGRQGMHGLLKQTVLLWYRMHIAIEHDKVTYLYFTVLQFLC